MKNVYGVSFYKPFYSTHPCVKSNNKRPIFAQLAVACKPSKPTIYWRKVNLSFILNSLEIHQYSEAPLQRPAA